MFKLIVRRHLWRWIVCLLGAAGVGTAVLSVFAPQVFVLFDEGFPGAKWPASGDFAVVAGDPSPNSPTMMRLPSEAVTRLEEAKGNALLVDHAGRFFGHFSDGVDADTRLNSYSLVKSLVGVLALRAVADGKIPSLDSPLPQILGPLAPEVTLNHALRMTSGLALAGEPPKGDTSKSLDDAEFSPFSAVARLHAFGIESLLPKLQVDREMQGLFHYQSANTALVGLAVERAYGQPLETLLSEMIWKPSGAGEAYWRKNPKSERVSAYCCLYARPADWLKVGRFLLNNGTADEPFLPADMWREWILPELPARERQQGAYEWQLRHDVLNRPGETLQGPFAYMLGHGGQVVYLLPDQDLVVVRFGAEMQLLHSTLYELVP